jgi:cytochrome d ubiquinol oxidase subunit II
VTLELTLGAVILAALVIYALSGGADHGGGMWDLLASGPRARRQRAAIEHEIGPIWEANHVWLILVVVVLFTAFPPAFATTMTALHIPMTAVLIGIVLRGSTFVFRKYDAQDDTIHRRWSTLFGAASFFTPFLLGMCLGALGSGEIRVVEGRLTSGFFAGWIRPFAVACGLFALGLFAFLAATYLTVGVEDESDLQEDFRTRALAAGLLLAPLAALTFWLAREGAGDVHPARLGLAQYPHLVVPDLTVGNTATARSTLRLLTWTLAVGAVVLLPSFAFLLYVFKRRPPQI